MAKSFRVGIGPWRASNKIEKSSSSVHDVLETRTPGRVGFNTTVPSDESSENLLMRP